MPDGIAMPKRGRSKLLAVSPEVVPPKKHDPDGTPRSIVERREIAQWRIRVLAYAALLLATIIGPSALLYFLT
jgi:hypothetical protein